LEQLFGLIDGKDQRRRSQHLGSVTRAAGRIRLDEVFQDGRNARCAELDGLAYFSPGDGESDLP
jgi:hypothetical protein